MDPTRVPLIGRARELDVLGVALDRVSRGSPALVVIEGEPGIGKTRLALAVADGARERDLARAMAAGAELERGRPFGIVADLLGLHAGSTDPHGARLASKIAGETAAGDGSSYAIAEDVLTLVERRALDGPTVFVLEDAHWADPGTCIVLNQIPRRCADLGVLLVVTARPDPRPPHLRAAIDTLLDAGASHLRLEPLDEDEIRTYVRELTGAAPGSSMDELLGATSGNPLFIGELLAALDEDGELRRTGATIEVAKPKLPPAVGLVILRRYAYLDDATLEVLRTAAVLGTTFTALDVATVMGQRAETLMGAFAQATRSGVLVAGDEALVFRHDLLREALYNDSPASVRLAMHDHAARALSRAGAPVEVVASHFRLCARPGDREAIDALVRGGRAALASVPATAADLFADALDLSTPDDPARERLVLDLAHALHRCGRTEDAIQLLETSDVEPIERALRLCDLHIRTGDDAAALADADRLLELTDADDARRALGLAYRSLALSDGGAIVEAEPVAQEALNLALRTSNDVAAAVALATLSVPARRFGHREQAVEFARRAVDHARRSHDPAALELHLEAYLAVALLDAGRHEEALRAVDSGMRAADASGSVGHVPRYMHMRASISYSLGAWDDLIAELRAAISLGRDIGIREVEGISLTLLADVAAQRDELDVAEEALRELGDIEDETHLMPWPECKLAWARGDLDGALEVARACWARYVERGLAGQGAKHTPDLVRFELEAGYVDRARRVADEMAALAQTMAIDPIVRTATLCRGLVERDAGLVLQVLPRTTVANHPFVAEDAGTILAEQERKTEAVERFEEAAAGYAALGADRYLRRVEGKLRELGRRRGVRGSRSRATTGWESLTETEQRVVGLVTEGLTNRDVGSRLFISGRTVETHLSHIYAKLAIPNRLALIRLATEHRGQHME